METNFAKEAFKKSFSPKQTQLVLGTLLGDGYLVKTTRGYALRINHSIKQKELVDWKYNYLKDFVNSLPQRTDNSYYFRTISHQLMFQLRSCFYRGRIKIIPKFLMKTTFSQLSLAVWIMDDGAREGKQIRINSQSFTLNENLWLIRFLSAKLGIYCTLNRDKNRFRLRVQANSMKKLIQSIKPYIIPSMLYKLSL